MDLRQVANKLSPSWAKTLNRPLRPHRLGVRTTDFQSVNTGSIPVGATTKAESRYSATCAEVKAIGTAYPPRHYMENLCLGLKSVVKVVEK